MTKEKSKKKDNFSSNWKNVVFILNKEKFQGKALRNNKSLSLSQRII